MSKYAFLGPAGTFTEEALLSMDREGVEPVSRSSIPEVFTAVERGEADFGIVPVENSIEGSVTATLDALAFDSDLRIQAEVDRDIHHMLIVSPGLTVEEIQGVASHPHASAQCRKWLARVLPGRPVMAQNSTAEAVRKAMEEPGVAAVGTELAAELNGAEVLFRSIEDYAENKTRFIVIGEGSPARTGDDKTSLALFIHHDQPGALLQILQEFSNRYLNLTKIESRPTKQELGQYMFFIDVAAHEDDEPLQQALKCLRCKLSEVKVLGSYSVGP